MTVHAYSIDVHRLPVVADLPTAARLLGIGRTSAYELVRTGQVPDSGHSRRATDPRADRPLLAMLGLAVGHGAKTGGHAVSPE